MKNYPIRSSSFLGKPIDPQKKYIIVGAGISGLLLGFHLKKAKIPFKITEKNNYGGGLLQSQKTEFGLVEKAANGFLWSREMQAVCDDLNLKILPPQPSAKARYLVKNKSLRKFPLSPLDAFRLILGFTKQHPQPFETMQDFGNYFLGKKITAQVLAPAMAGIYAAPLEKLSFPGAMKKLAAGFNESNYLHSAMKNLKSTVTAADRKKRTAGTHSFQNGMGELVATLTDHLQQEIEWNVDGISLKNENENLMLTTPAYVTKNHFDGQLYEHLAAIKYIPMISVTLFFPEGAFEKIKKGFGCLIPRNEGLKTLGILFNSYIFNHRVSEPAALSLTCMLRDDSPDQNLINQSDHYLKQLIIKELDILFFLKKEPLHIEITRWKKGIPIYSPQLFRAWSEMDTLLKTQFPHRNIFGNFTGEISVRGLCQTTHSIYQYLK